MPLCGRWIIPASRFAIQNDDHDQQNAGSSSRDMGDKGSVLIKERNVPKHREFEVNLFARNDADWRIRLVLSSYSFAANGGAEFPDGLSDCALYKGAQGMAGCKGVKYSPAYDVNGCGYSVLKGNQWLDGVYTRVHRDVAIVNAMRAWMGLPKATNAGLGLAAECL
ncbi:hypothetical protein DFJ77DRAFT_23164 [Powellomyces hirtus]|nr:hypothetical protein DFJ77DRAFT_23164 [Powellomyces hirtus]